MPVFEIEAGGKTYEVDAPDQNTALASIQQMGQQPPRGMMDKLLGTTGPRYQTWPERAVRDIAGLPKQVMDAAGSAPPGSSELTANMVPSTTQAAAAFSPMAPRAGMTFRGAQQTPTQEQLFKSGGDLYNQARGMDFMATPEALTRISGEAGAMLNSKGVNETLAPKTFSVVNQGQKQPEGAIGANIDSFETMRRSFGYAAKDKLNETEQLAAGLAKKHLDDSLATLPQSDLVSGDAAAISGVLSKARGEWGAGERSKDLTESLSDAYFRSQANNSGKNIGNGIRQEVNKIRANDGRNAGYSPAEMAQAERVVEGTQVGNKARRVANVLGGGGGLGQLGAIYAGATYGGPLGAVLGPAVGMAAKGVENMSVKRQARILDDMLRSRSPLAESMRAPQDSAGRIPASVLAKMLLEQQQQ